MSTAFLAFLLYLALFYALGVIAQAATTDSTPKIRFVRVSVQKLILRPQTRSHSPEYLRRLADSLLQGQLQPVGILKDGTVIFGNGRVLAARLEPKITDLWAVVLEEEISEREFLRRQAVENFVRNDLSNMEKCKICVNYAKSAPDMALKDIAADLGVDGSMVTRWLAWEKCIEAVRDALAADKITLTAMYSISQLPQEQQQAALDAALNGKKKPQKSNGSRIPTIKIPLANDNATGLVTVAGDGLNWEDAENLLKEALKSVRAAKDKNLDPKTAQSFWRDVAGG